jgi:DnaJ family protein C protein 28
MSDDPSSIHVYRADEPLLPAVEGHKPWLTTFKVPSHATASIRYGHISTAGTASSSTSSTRRAAQAGPTDDDRTRRKEREIKKRSEIVGRLTRAKESTLDYRLGVTKNMKSGMQERPNPVSVKGWAGLVEVRIEVRVFHQRSGNDILHFSIQQARQEGHFRTIKGRGKPLERGNEEHNPFIAREEFLMNRIVRRQGAAPPWVEIQGELQAALDTFRSVLKQSWVRRAVRMLTLSRQPPRELSLADARALRDREWEARERAYHESALAEVNTLVRKYNALAPYAVRKVYYVRDVELDRAYEEGAEDIVRELAGRVRGSQAGDGNLEDRAVRDEEGDSEQTVMRVQSQEGNVLRLRDLFRQWLRGRGS